MERGFALIEAIVGIGIALTLLVTMTMLIVQATHISRAGKDRFIALLYLREAIEISKDLEQSNWDLIANAASVCATICHPEASSSAWTLVAGNETLDGGTYTRFIRAFPVFRNQLTFPNIIVESGGVFDPNTKKVSATIAWQNAAGPHTMSLETYIYNLP